MMPISSIRWRTCSFVMEGESLLQRVLQHQRVRYHALAGLDAGYNLLHISRKHITTNYLDTAELAVPVGLINPIAIVQVKNRRCRYYRAHLPGLTVECRRHKHADAQHPRVLNLQAYLGGPDGRIEDWADVVDAPLQSLTRVGVQVDIGDVAN